MDDPQFSSWLAELRNDRTHGASELARQCLDQASQSAVTIDASDLQQFRERLNQRCEAMISTRPSMAPIAHLLDRWQRALISLPRAELDVTRRSAAGLAEELIIDSRRAATMAAARAATIIGDAKTLLTHSFSSTVLSTFESLRNRGVSAIVTESRPLNEGHAAAQRLSQLSIPVMLITEAQIGLAIRDADAVLVGADGILADGSIVNKVGTYLLALAAFDHNIPFYVCTESFKRWPRRMTPREHDLEEKDTGELGAPAWPGVRVRNVYFDITPARLITCCITEAEPAT